MQLVLLLFLEIAETCVEKYNTLKKLHGHKPKCEEFTAESILNNITYVNATTFVELIAAVKYMEKLLKEHQRVSLLFVA